MRYFIGFMITVGLFIFLIFLLFRGDGQPKTPTTNRVLTSYSGAGEVSMLIDGPTNADSLHQQIRITVDRDSATYEQMQGYQGSVVKQQSFPNNEAAYANFLRALSVNGFTQGNTDKALQDERGYCASGSRYIFELREGLRNIQRFWTTSCGSPKTYLGNYAETVTLFQAQIPNYADLSQNVTL